MKKIIHNKGKITSCLVVIFMLAILVVGCGTSTEEQPDSIEPQQKNVEKNPIVTITMSNNEEITIELYPNTAPNTVTNFISLVEKGFYNGLIFHRVIPSFMIQGGDPEGTGTGGPGYGIKGEFSSNDFENNIKHDRGVISMARAKDPNSAGSQFFIMVNEASHLDGDYAAFGKVIEGMETVDKIVQVDSNAQNKPVEEQVMKNVTVETFGVEYGNPIVVE
jgi:peptidyl-prolyl cis-trans isomerase B (cyclophilin B)